MRFCRFSGGESHSTEGVTGPETITLLAKANAEILILRVRMTN